MPPLKRQPSVLFSHAGYNFRSTPARARRNLTTQIHPLTQHGRHFGRTVNAFCDVLTVLGNGIVISKDISNNPGDLLTPGEQRDFGMYLQLLSMVHNLEEDLVNKSEHDVSRAAKLIKAGIVLARKDDADSLRGVILDWITPPGCVLSPPLHGDVKSNRGFNHDLTGALLCPADLDWSDGDVKERLRYGWLTFSCPGDHLPAFVFENYTFIPDDPWYGLFRSAILVLAFQHIFMSTSAIEKEPKTQPGDKCIHGITEVTLPSIAYAATQVRHALSSSHNFATADAVISSRQFYASIMEFFDEFQQDQKIIDLLSWWNG